MAETRHSHRQINNLFKGMLFFQKKVQVSLGPLPGEIRGCRQDQLLVGGGAEDFSSSRVAGWRPQPAHCHGGPSLPGPRAAATPSREASRHGKEAEARLLCVPVTGVVSPHSCLTLSIRSKPSAPAKLAVKGSHKVMGTTGWVSVGSSQRLPATLSQTQGWAGGQAFGFFSHPGETELTSDPWGPRPLKPSPSAGGSSALPHRFRRVVSASCIIKL